MKHMLILAHYGLIDDAIPYDEASNINICCPFHDDKNPSLTMYQDGFKCWSPACNERGSLLDFIVKYEHITGNDIDTYQAIILLSKMQKFSSIKIVKREGRKVSDEELLEMSKSFFNSLKTPTWDVLNEHYLISERKFSQKILEKNKVRLNSGSTHPIILPLYESEKFIGYVSRRGDDKDTKLSKYINSKGMDRGNHISGKLRRGSVWVFEGEFDRYRAEQYGIDNGACTLGAYCSDGQAAYIKQFATSVVCCYDPDSAGRVGSRLLQSRFEDIPFYEIPFYGNKDVDQMSYEEFKRAEYNIIRVTER